ncbi:cinnamoyl-CoA reductase 1 [Senna tora]|uniref:Cinnamoyl-CoA reductase 1 n=1 Tax=Senna tora TaxID=362788 RepID=A0A834W2G2_9FABA|nr:cinnamoyl-CoA reductase 1 [Senna tora]
MVSGEGKVVCVTGGNGYIASWIVKLLLQRGYTVKATVRNPDDEKKVEHLLNLEGAKERLQLIKADLLEEGSFDSAVDGCDGVFHTASPFAYNTELIDPALKGTLNVLKSCAKSASIKRVVYTSSIASVIYNGKPRGPEDVVDETWYSDSEWCTKRKVYIYIYWCTNNIYGPFWYLLSKTLADEAAWKFVKENKIDMVSINPGMVIGPLLQPTINQSATVILNLINGTKTYPNFSLGWANVKDVAYAHVQAFEIPSANGRYLVVESVSHYSEVVNKLRDMCADDKRTMPKYQVSKEKAKSLGIEFTPFEEFVIAREMSFVKAQLKTDSKEVMEIILKVDMATHYHGAMFYSEAQLELVHHHKTQLPSFLTLELDHISTLFPAGFLKLLLGNAFSSQLREFLAIKAGFLLLISTNGLGVHVENLGEATFWLCLIDLESSEKEYLSLCIVS